LKKLDFHFFNEDNIKFGAGINLYFYFLRYFSGVFLLFSIISGYSIHLNYKGTGLQEWSLINKETDPVNKFLLKTTLGNIDFLITE